MSFPKYLRFLLYLAIYASFSLGIWNITSVSLVEKKGTNVEVRDVAVENSTTVITDLEEEYRDSNCYLHHRSKNISCSKPVEVVFYLKTYKTGSSTITSLMYRFAWKHDIPIVPVLFDTYPDPIRDEAVAPPLNGSTGLKYNILPEHIKFECQPILKYLKPDARFTVSLRHPLSHYKSIVHEFRLKYSLKISSPDPAHYILHNLDKYKELLNNSRGIGATKSLQCRQLGLELSQLDNPDVVDSFIQSIDKIFDFFIINEYFDESMVLLRRKFCWQTQDIYYLVQRYGSLPGYIKYKTAQYDEKTRKIHEKWSAADYKLYHFFLKKFLIELESMPQDYWDELAQYKIINGQIADFCNGIEEKLKQNTSAIYAVLGNWTTGEGIASITIDPSPWGDAFKVDAFDCALMKLDTVVARNLLRFREDREYCSYKIKDQNLIWCIKKVGDTVHMNREYCMDWSDAFHAPIKVFADPVAYMWKY